MFIPNAVVAQSLVTLFEHLADAVDGGEELPQALHDAYVEEFAKPEVQRFYGELIDANRWGV